VRTTLDIDEDVLLAAKSLAAQRGQPIGRIVSDLARKALRPVDESPKVRNGVPVFPPKHVSPPPDDALVNRLRDEEP